MKRKLLALASSLALCLPMFAAFYMCVKFNDGDILKLDVEEIEKVLYEKFSTDTDTIPTSKKSYMHIRQKNGDSARYDVRQIEEVFYEFYNDSSIIDTMIIDTTIVDTTIIDTTIVDTTIIDTTIVEPIDTLSPILRYRILSDSTVGVSGYDKNQFMDDEGIILNKEIVVPAKVQIDGVSYTVTEISDSAFYKCSGLTGITLPSTITSIQDDAFSDCIGLENIEIPSNVKYIGEEAFQGCTRLTDIKIPSSVTTIREWAFYGCERLELLIDNSEENIEIGRDAFSWCRSVTFIRKNAVVSDSIETKLHYVFLSDSTVEITADSLKLGSTKSITIPSSVTIDNRTYKVTSIGNYAFDGCTQLKNVVIPSTVSHIGYEAFAYNREITSITIPESVTNISERAFYHCDSLLNIVIPSGIDSIRTETFANCSKLTRVMLTGVTSIGKGAFSQCSNLASVNIPETVTEIQDEAFANCTELESIEIPESVLYLGQAAFSGCEKLRVLINNSEDDIHVGKDCFKDCRSVKYTKESAYIVDTIGSPLIFRITSETTVGVSELNTTSIDTIVIPSKVRISGNVYSVTSIEPGALLGGEMISVYIPSSVTLIKDSAFAHCRNLTDIRVDAENPNYSSADGILYNKEKTDLIYAAGGISGEISIDTTVVNIKYEAFYENKGLTKILIPQSVTNIDELAFYGCDNLDVVVDNSQYEMEIATSAFGKCKSVTFTKDDPSVVNDTDTRIKFNILTDSTVEVGQCLKTQMFGAITVPEKVRINKKIYTVVSIGNSAFDNCSLITSMELPETISNIGDNAFNFCSGLSKINIPEAVTSIGEMAFSDCSNLISITLSSNVANIGTQAFAYCQKLNITIDNLEDNVEIGSNAFYSCKSVKFAE